jgi:release factor glutamine methyltransferase
MRLEAHLRAAAARLRESDTARLDVRLLAMRALGLDAAGLILAAERELSDAELAALDVLVARRERGEPVAHIIGRREFWSLDLEVEPGVLVPRPDTETLINAAIARRDRRARLRVLDLGCGSGAILCALLTAFPHAEGLGVDVDPAAVALADRNLRRLGLGARGRAAPGDWFAGLAERFDLILANPPYIPEGDRALLAREVRDFEAPRALFSGADGLDDIRRILAGAPRRLAADGLTILEFGAGQAPAVAALARAAFPGAAVDIKADLGGRPRAAVIDLAPQKTG